MISERMRSRIRIRAKGLCEYCLCPAQFTRAHFHCEHILPVSAGGETILENLAWACPSCNQHKHIKTHAIDPQTALSVILFNPRLHKWNQHFGWSEDLRYIVGKTPIDRATVEALVVLNRQELINLRQLLIGAGEHPPQLE